MRGLNHSPAISHGKYQEESNDEDADCIVPVAAAVPQDAKVTPLRTQELVGIAGKEVTMLTVEYPRRVVGRAPAQCLCVCLCTRRRRCNAGEGRKGGDLGSGSDILRVAGGRAYGFPERKHYKACQVPGVLCEAKRGSANRGSKVMPP